MIRSVVTVLDRYVDWLNAVDRPVYWTWFALGALTAAGTAYILLTGQL